MVSKMTHEATRKSTADEETQRDETSCKAATGKEIELLEKVKAKEKEAADNYDKYLRIAAELENYRKRAIREKSEAIKYGNENLLRDLLPMVDSLDRALEHASSSSDFKAFTEGLKLIQNQLACYLDKYGVTHVDCIDKDFDPNVHEAMLQVESAQHGDNKVVCEFEKGYMLNGRLLRPARVSVCKRSGKEKQPEAEASGKKIEITA
jgi:molecular chaperone GrpE